MSAQKNKIDVLVIVALEEEMKGFEPKLPRETRATEAGKFTIHKYTDASNSDHPIEIGIWILWDMGPERILLDLENIIRETNPSFVVNVGIAGMMNGDARIGDVVIATDVNYYQYRGAIDDAEKIKECIKFGGKPFPCFPDAQKESRSYHEQNPEIWGAIKRESENLRANIGKSNIDLLIEKRLIHPTIKLLFGPICSGSNVSRSSVFKKSLLDLNRNYLCIEMEAGGVAWVLTEKFSHLPFLIVKGVSDPGDENKHFVDTSLKGQNRRWAVQNAFETAMELVRHNFRKITYQKSHQLILVTEDPEKVIVEKCIEWFLPKPYNEIAAKRGSFDDQYISGLSKVISLSPLTSGSTPVEELYNCLVSNTTKSPVSLSGRPGTGKTSLLCLLYLHWLMGWEKGLTKTLPVLVGIRPSIGFRSETDQRTELTQDEQFDKIEATLELALKLQRKGRDISIVLLVDSGEAETSFVNRVREYYRDFLKKIPVKSIASSRTLKTNHNAPGSKYSLNPIKRTRDNLMPFCKAFINLVQPNAEESKPEKLAEYLWRTGTEEIDLFDANMGLQMLDAELGGRFKHEAFALEDYARFRLEQLGVPENEIPKYISEASDYAFNKEHRRTSEADLEKLKHPARALVRAHPRIHDYLVARRIINDLVAYNKDEIIPDSLNCVYPQRINRIAKELMCVHGIETQNTCVINSINIIDRDDASYCAKACVVYLIGRTGSEQLQGIVQDALKRKVDEARGLHASQGNKTDGNHQALLYARTVYISLAYLGDVEASNEYVSLLATNKILDEINRGFHLEYFGDQKYDVNLPLQNQDSLKDCPLTYEYLFTRLTSVNKSPLFEIELQTFCSLALQRHAQNRLSNEFRNQIFKILKMDCVWMMVNNAELKDYLRMVEWCISENHLSSAGIFQKFLALKDQPRMGWKFRGIQPCESVADHTIGAMLVGLFFLPEKHQDKGYNKEKILQMLLIHDLGEAITGDYLPTQKGEPEEEDELKVFRRMRYIGVIPGLTDQDKAFQLYQEFNALESINSKIAKDIDRLEMLFQMHRYMDAGKKIDDYTNVIKSINDQIKTSIGREIFKQITHWRKLSESTASN